MRTTALWIAWTTASVLVAGCARMTPEEKIVQRAFEAIRQGDWESYYGTTITAADIMMQQNEVGPFQAQQSYLGSSVRPRERDAQRAQFERVADSPVAQANLRTARFVALGADRERFEYTLLTGGSIPVTSYSLRVDVDGNEVALAVPRFLVVDWQDRPHVLALLFEPDATR